MSTTLITTIIFPKESFISNAVNCNRRLLEFSGIVGKERVQVFFLLFNLVQGESPGQFFLSLVQGQGPGQIQDCVLLTF